MNNKYPSETQHQKNWNVSCRPFGEMLVCKVRFGKSVNKWLILSVLMAKADIIWNILEQATSFQTENSNVDLLVLLDFIFSLQSYS